MRHVPPNNGMQRTALRTAADAERLAHQTQFDGGACAMYMTTIYFTSARSR
jgi:hypothetical protein